MGPKRQLAYVLQTRPFAPMARMKRRVHEVAVICPHCGRRIDKPAFAGRLRGQAARKRTWSLVQALKRIPKKTQIHALHLCVSTNKPRFEILNGPQSRPCGVLGL